MAKALKLFSVYYCIVQEEGFVLIKCFYAMYNNNVLMMASYILKHKSQD